MSKQYDENKRGEVARNRTEVKAVFNFWSHRSKSQNKPRTSEYETANDNPQTPTGPARGKDVTSSAAGDPLTTRFLILTSLQVVVSPRGRNGGSCLGLSMCLSYLLDNKLIIWKQRSKSVGRPKTKHSKSDALLIRALNQNSNAVREAAEMVRRLSAPAKLPDPPWPSENLRSLCQSRAKSSLSAAAFLCQVLLLQKVGKSMSPDQLTVIIAIGRNSTKQFRQKAQRGRVSTVYPRTSRPRCLPRRPLFKCHYQEMVEHSDDWNADGTLTRHGVSVYSCGL